MSAVVGTVALCSRGRWTSCSHAGAPDAGTGRGRSVPVAVRRSWRSGVPGATDADARPACRWRPAVTALRTRWRRLGRRSSSTVRPDAPYTASSSPDGAMWPGPSPRRSWRVTICHPSMSSRGCPWRVDGSPSADTTKPGRLPWASDGERGSRSCACSAARGQQVPKPGGAARSAGPWCGGASMRRAQRRSGSCSSMTSSRPGRRPRRAPKPLPRPAPAGSTSW